MAVKKEKCQNEKQLDVIKLIFRFHLRCCIERCFKVLPKQYVGFLFKSKAIFGYLVSETVAFQPDSSTVANSPRPKNGTELRQVFHKKRHLRSFLSTASHKHNASPQNTKLCPKKNDRVRKR